MIPELRLEYKRLSKDRNGHGGQQGHLADENHPPPRDGTLFICGDEGPGLGHGLGAGADSVVGEGGPGGPLRSLGWS